MLKFISMTGLLVILAAGVFISGCGQSASPTPAPTASAVPTLGQMAVTGKTLYASRCASCHGDQGQGARAPAVIGAGAHLAKYNTAQGLLDFVDTTMPANAPGSLSHQEYLDLVSYLLTQNNNVSAETKFDENQLINLPIK